MIAMESSRSPEAAKRGFDEAFPPTTPIRELKRARSETPGVEASNYVLYDGPIVRGTPSPIKSELAPPIKSEAAPPVKNEAASPIKSESETSDYEEATFAEIGTQVSHDNHVDASTQVSRDKYVDVSIQVPGGSYETTATQTDPIPVPIVFDTATQTTPVMFAEQVWAQELSAIRRRHPLMKGKCITVKTRARPASITSGAKNNTHPTHSSHFPRDSPLKSTNVATTKRPLAVIDLLDSSDDDNIPLKTSSRVGGAEFVSSDDPDDKALVADAHDEHFSGTTMVGSSEIVEGTANYGHDTSSSDHTADSRGVSYDMGNEAPGYHGQDFSLMTPGALPRSSDIYASHSGSFDAGPCQLLDAEPNENLEREEIDSDQYDYGMDGFAPPRVEDSSFYRGGEEDAHLLRYQDRWHNIGQIPSPSAGTRLDLESYLGEMGLNIAHKLEWNVRQILLTTGYGGHSYDEDEAVRRVWRSDPQIKLYSGFPLVEDVEFLATGNNRRPPGDCYWRALAMCLHGDSDLWKLIKAEHLEFMFHVLTNETHPRHKLYSEKLNNRFFESRGPNHLSFKANIWQLLNMPHSWTPGVTQQISADLYNIHLVTFTYDHNKNFCSEVSVRGAYNSRHIFMLFMDNMHFQPLTPNEYLATAHFNGAPKGNSTKVLQSIQHPWRNDWTKEVPAPVPRNHGCDMFELSRLMDAKKAAQALNEDTKVRNWL
ncbi:hypothetical protein F5Y16DRAFT_420457 [Xylariaceae sp. FL0255]|nr:hypothetical protein F5Y16DRAFT_420457 [Xylariaceae sp. FL0255]